jgi:hypothetical protein
MRIRDIGRLIQQATSRNMLQHINGSQEKKIGSTKYNPVYDDDDDD